MGLNTKVLRQQKLLGRINCEALRNNLPEGRDEHHCASEFNPVPSSRRSLHFGPDAVWTSELRPSLTLYATTIIVAFLFSYALLRNGLLGIKVFLDRK